jgi:hypothetical protein
VCCEHHKESCETLAKSRLEPGRTVRKAIEAETSFGYLAERLVAQSDSITGNSAPPNAAWHGQNIHDTARIYRARRAQRCLNYMIHVEEQPLCLRIAPSWMKAMLQATVRTVLALACLARLIRRGSSTGSTNELAQNFPGCFD